ncbi:formylglycine-generating enzyme family protein [Spirulina subsalsa FACHB-351]|uniref:Formylglycine-generating enzyme family protein n=1 Tax=Spirulina subsalsa FACHB-351 TaxID=234711 RepID=A0ABT3LBH8_9CYAN|nr:formylglycine-generating enzyme family protein [Spirulina subsalsa]MCW6038853.1 formylglycine-generating enzyme family protein [Spirulina subsalsa FACHB-351]
MNEQEKSIQGQKTEQQGYRETTGGLNLEMVVIGAGEFIMGSPEDEPERYSTESPQHRVILPEFFMSQTPITQEQWRIVAQLPPVVRSLPQNPSHFKGPNNPVEQVSWEDCLEFCLRLNQASGQFYRLPSEAEWEYACRAGTTTPYSFGLTLSPQVANCRHYDGDNRGKTGRKTIPVGSLNAPNAWGIHDMHGNVWEWCLDDWHDHYEGAPRDGRAWLNHHSKAQNQRDGLRKLLEDNRSAKKLLRGGSWLNLPEYCRSACRDSCPPSLKSDYMGFRLVQKNLTLY